MNESDPWNAIIPILLIFVIAQTLLLYRLWQAVRGWADVINRKLHRIESNTRHAAEAAGYIEKEHEHEH